MKQKWGYVLTGLVFVVAIAISAVTFLVPKNSNPKENSVTISAEDITMTRGDIVEDFYSITDDSIEVKFEIENKNLVSIQGNDIKGLRQGQTKVKIIANVEENEVSQTINVVIKDDETCIVSAGENCYIENEIIYAQSTMFSINLNFYDKIGEKIGYDFEITSEDAITTTRFGTVIVETEKDCMLKIVFNSRMSEKIIQIKMQTE